MLRTSSKTAIRCLTFQASQCHLRSTSLPAVGTALHFMGPWVPSLAVSNLLITPMADCFSVPCSKHALQNASSASLRPIGTDTNVCLRRAAPRHDPHDSTSHEPHAIALHGFPASLHANLVRRFTAGACLQTFCTSCVFSTCCDFENPSRSSSPVAWHVDDLFNGSSISSPASPELTSTRTHHLRDTCATPRHARRCPLRRSLLTFGHRFRTQPMVTRMRTMLSSASVTTFKTVISDSLAASDNCFPSRL